MSDLTTTDESKMLSITVNEEIPWLFLGASILSAIILIVTKTRRVVAWLLPLSLAGAGAAKI